MNIFCSGVKIIFINKILRIKLLRQLMTFLTVQLLFDKLSHTFLMLLFFRTYLTRHFLKHTVVIYTLRAVKKAKTSKGAVQRSLWPLTDHGTYNVFRCAKLY
jgi:hypothetical protein